MGPVPHDKERAGMTRSPTLVLVPLFLAAMVVVVLVAVVAALEIGLFVGVSGETMVQPVRPSAWKA